MRRCGRQPIRDLAIEDAPLDEVIRALYASADARERAVMTAAQVAKYAAFSRIAATQARRERGELYGRVVVFRRHPRRVLEPVARGRAKPGCRSAADPRALVWYLAVTEWILLSAPPIHIEIQEAIRRGDVVYRLGRPVSYVGAEFAEGLGLLAVRRAGPWRDGVSSARSRSPDGCRRCAALADGRAVRHWRRRRCSRRCICGSACSRSGSRTSRRCTGYGRN